MWNSQTEMSPKFFKKHTHLKRCLYYNHLPHNPISAARRQKKLLQKKKPLPWLSQNNQDPYADDYDKYTPWQRNEEKIKTLQAVAKIVAEAIFSVHSSLDLLREVSNSNCYYQSKNHCLFRAKTGQKPLMMIRATATKHLIGQDKNTFKMYIMMHQIWAMYTSNLFLQNKWLTDPLADLGCLMLQEDAVKSLNFFLTTYLLR